MDAPLESLAPNIQARLKSIEGSIAKASTIDKLLSTATLLQKFYIGVASTKIGRLFVERSIKDAEQFAIEFFTRGADWVDDATRILYKEGLETAREAIAAQLSSAFGKALPADFAFSQTQKRMIWERARTSAKSIASTYNKMLPKWVKEIKEQWIFEHGSLKGLQRWTIIKRMGREHMAWERMKNPQIATTEFAYQWRDAVSLFADGNPEVELECQILPEHASERDTPIYCKEFAGFWFHQKEALSLVPQHINCIHYIGQSRNIGKVPAYLRLGEFGYGLEGLKEI